MKLLLKFLPLLIACNLLACAAPDEETRLRDTLTNLVNAIEERSVFQVQKYLSNDFKTTRHNNTQQLKAFMLIHFRQNQVINVFTSDIQLQIQDQKADVTFEALVTGSSNWLPERGRSFHVESRWLRQDGDWKISRVNWKEQGF